MNTKLGLIADKQRQVIKAPILPNHTSLLNYARNIALSSFSYTSIFAVIHINNESMARQKKKPFLWISFGKGIMEIKYELLSILLKLVIRLLLFFDHSLNRSLQTDQTCGIKRYHSIRHN